MNGELNLLVIAHCVAKALPYPNDVKELFSSAWHVDPSFLPFIARKNDTYGVHIVRGGTLKTLKAYYARVVECDLGYDNTTRSKDNAGLYLSIINNFSDFVWLVYVTGLREIEDSLLKWLAEYTRAHPWRFVYLENCQTSWNFSENRDRCILDRAPPPIERGIRCKEDLDRDEIKKLRPHHTQKYPRIEHVKTSDLKGLDWDRVSSFTRAFFSMNTSSGEKVAVDGDAGHRPVSSGSRWESAGAEKPTEGRELDSCSLAKELAEGKTEFTEKQWTQFGIGDLRSDDFIKAGDLYFKPSDVGWTDCFDTASEDYQNQVSSIMVGSSEPCVILLCSPPGAGKSYFANELKEKIKKTHKLVDAFIDGSDDRLVEMALAEILKVELPDPSRAQFLVLDEFHMLKEHHKQEFFEWLKVHARRLHVLLIANRKDANDEELLNQLKNQAASVGVPHDRIRIFTTRLSRKTLQTVMDKRKTRHDVRDSIFLWMHCSRCVFGGEAVSLRGIAELERLLGQESIHSNSRTAVLMRLLLDKIPTVSEKTARDFVTCFLKAKGKKSTEALEAVKQVAGAVSLMVQASLLTEKIDDFGTDFPDFVATKLQRAYDAGPALRIAAWCAQMRACAGAKAGAKSDENMNDIKTMLTAMEKPEGIFETTFVDQCGFPLQLEDNDKAGLSEGLAFSWAGDYARITDIINAVKHGHSVDWTSVHNRCWVREPVQDYDKLQVLLSVSTSPASVLKALTKDNLCTLLKKSPPDPACYLAKKVLTFQIRRIEAVADKLYSPYRTALWINILYNKDCPGLGSILDCLDRKPVGEQTRVDLKELYWREIELADGLYWASLNMKRMRQIRSDEDPKEKCRFLTDILEDLSTSLMQIAEKDPMLIASNREDKVAQLWSGWFAQLLRFKKSSPDQNKLIQYVAINSPTFQPEWKQPLPSLWRIAHGSCSQQDVDRIWSKPDLQELLFEGTGILAGGLLQADIIDRKLQRQLLTRNCKVDMSRIANNKVFLFHILPFLSGVFLDSSIGGQ